VAVLPSGTRIDLDGPILELARAEAGGAGIEYVQADVLTHPFRPSPSAWSRPSRAAPHRQRAAGLERMRELLRPGRGTRLHVAAVRGLSGEAAA
jgi:hypothetical protein